MRYQGGEENDSHSATFQCRKFKEGRSVILQFIFLLVLILDFTLLSLEMENGPTLRVIQ